MDMDFLNNQVHKVAPQLLGCELVRHIGEQQIRVRITEVEAYDQTDEASHTFKGRTARCDTMFGPSGHLYVYFTYGMHYCCNIVAGEDGYGAGVLVRAVEPIEGEAIMLENRRGKGGKQLSNGPGKVCQALGINKAFDGHDLKREPLQLIRRPALPTSRILVTPRIGISKAKETPWRFLIKP